ncbi:undecaprenyl-diphosphatase UppP [Candidatus Kaiserbacteria bacterium RIFCSPHIGHO2_02_FULL_49_34]|uniref:Undecaprenyl-diphosphatase n=1 Tax=Candidatus Kaiserbacteria bacterium RIFCSPHIGHO2_02_FULL_49_34 TaxID=1798491 RepID=A0A1F6DLX2_9BACT|nr:MAG: undecaprenyl-diphosphatase UppP [Candidatus Kaiserbacteria bacterium RIFCSPHIGHO2_02_FULL_49_34]
MTALQAIFYGIAQGLTEFLPVSSSGHLALLHALNGFIGEAAFTFDIALHIATALAVVVYFRADLKRLIYTVFRKLGRLPVDRRDWVLLRALILATIPAAVVGVFLEDIIVSAFREPLMIAGVLLAGSAYLAWAEHRVKDLNTEKLTIWRGVLIGCAQVLALFPGFSRSGATIGAGMMLGMSRSDAARFSFLLALPIILGAGGVKIIRASSESVPIEWSIFLAGGIASFITGLFVIRFLLNFVRSHTLWPFIWYRVALAGMVIGIVVW